MENLLNFGLSSTEVGEVRGQGGDTIAPGGDGEEATEDSDSLPPLLSGNGEGWNSCGNCSGKSGC